MSFFAYHGFKSQITTETVLNPIMKVVLPVTPMVSTHQMIGGLHQFDSDSLLWPSPSSSHCIAGLAISFLPH